MKLREYTLETDEIKQIVYLIYIQVELPRWPDNPARPTCFHITWVNNGGFGK